tara:strand:+ start:175 stop:540 length:366 start_codon:yes stop_codon:yes gene_type:complete
MSKPTLSFVDKVIAFVKGGDEAKLARFQKKYVKANLKQISIRQDEIDTIQEKLDDLAEKSAEDLIAVNFDSIATSELTEQYIEKYRIRQLNNLRATDEFDEKINELKEEIEEYKALNEQVK